MKNGVLETIGSTLITGIGQLMGRLIGVNSIEDGILYFVHQPAKSGQQGDLASTVFVEDGKYYLYNPEVQKNDRFVSGALPGMGNIGAQTVTLGKRQSFDITPLFQQGADHDNTSFEITACQAGQVKLGSQQSSFIFSLSFDFSAVASAVVEGMRIKSSAVTSASLIACW